MSGSPSDHEPEIRSVAEKILKVQDLWDEIAREAGDADFTPEQREEAERRLLIHEANPQPCESWEELRRRLGGEG